MRFKYVQSMKENKRIPTELLGTSFNTATLSNSLWEYDREVDH
jgi:hypothetical protein